MVKIFHTADVHLDAPFSLSDPIEAEKRRTELRATFCSLILRAKSFGAQLFLISGDLFEDSFVTKDTAQIVLREIASFPECRFFITPGNHDPYHKSSPYALLRWPENVHIFKDEEPTFVEIPELGVRVYGHAYKDKDLKDGILSRLTSPDDDKINILMAHGYINTPGNSQNALMKSEIEKSVFDYIALGHIHAHGGIEKLGNTTFAYSGCPVGRSFDECGYKCAIYGEIEKGNANLKTYRCSERRFEIARITLSGCTDTDSALSVIKDACGSYLDDTALRIIVEGAVSPDVHITVENVRSVVRAPFYLELINNTLPLFDTEKLRQDKTVLGAFFRQIEPQLLSDDIEVRKRASLALRYGLSALCGNDITNI